jgi:hypothetical protein
LTVGTTYFISGVTAGVAQILPPVTGQEDPIFVVPDADNIDVLASVGGATTYRRAFVQADLSPPVLTVTHNLDKQYVHVTVYRDTGVKVASNLLVVTATGVNGLTIDFTGLTPPLAGTWHLIVTG